MPSYEGLPTFSGGRSYFGLEELGCAWEEGRRGLLRRGSGAEEIDAPWLSSSVLGDTGVTGKAQLRTRKPSDSTRGDLFPAVSEADLLQGTGPRRFLPKSPCAILLHTYCANHQACEEEKHMAHNNEKKISPSKPIVNSQRCSNTLSLGHIKCGPHKMFH